MNPNRYHKDRNEKRLPRFAAAGFLTESKAMLWYMKSTLPSRCFFGTLVGYHILIKLSKARIL